MCDRTTSPEWNEAFCFLTYDPREDILVVKVSWHRLHDQNKTECVGHTHKTNVFHMLFQLSHSWTLPIGSLVVPLRELLSEPELFLDQWFHLDGASPESQILLRIELKVRLLCLLLLILFVLFSVFHICLKGKLLRVKAVNVLIVLILQMLIPSKCPGATDKAKVTSVSGPSPAQPKQEADTALR